MTKPTDEFTVYKIRVQGILGRLGWSPRGIFYAFKDFKVREAFNSKESPEAFAIRVDSDAPLGMAT